MHLKDRGEWVHDPFKGSSFWSFLIEEYRGSVWIYAIWRLLKKFLFTLVLTLTDGIVSASCAILVQMLDTTIILHTRPNIGRDSDFIECFGAVTNLLTIVWLAIPVLSRGLLNDIFAEEISVWLSMFSTAMAAIVTLVPSYLVFLAKISDLTAIFRCLGVAHNAVADLTGYLCWKAEGEMREHLRRKYMRDLALEERTVRLQILLLNCEMKNLTQPLIIPSASSEKTSLLRLGLRASLQERRIVYLLQALSLLAQVQVSDVQVEFKEGPRQPVSTKCERPFGITYNDDQDLQGLEKFVPVGSLEEPSVLNTMSISGSVVESVRGLAVLELCVYSVCEH